MYAAGSEARLKIAAWTRAVAPHGCCALNRRQVPAAGLVLICYPLHPPGKPEKLRVDHFPQLDLPCLFVSGTKDPFGTPEEFGDACAYLCSAQAGFMTGQNVLLDGGNYPGTF